MSSVFLIRILPTSDDICRNRCSLQHHDVGKGEEPPISNTSSRVQHQRSWQSGCHGQQHDI
jgi:hypothetical protein